MGVRSALLDVLDNDDLDAVTVRCFDLLGDPGTSGCLALASLNDDGIVAGCEGDVPSALAMLWVRHLLDQPTWMANPATLDVDRNELVLAHCTVAPSMVDSFALDTHFESGMGVGISGQFAAQPVTLIRLGGADLDECWIAEGDIVSTGDDADLCRTQVTIALSSGTSATCSRIRSATTSCSPPAPRAAPAQLVASGRRRLTVTFDPARCDSESGPKRIVSSVRTSLPMRAGVSMFTAAVRDRRARCAEARRIERSVRWSPRP
jgi:hypothetical protein